MQNKVKENIIKNRLLTPGDRCLLAVSGGADSVGLMTIMTNLSKELEFEIRVIHVNHCLRGAESDRDEEFVRKLCREQKIDCRTVSVNVAELVEQTGQSTEEAARNLRYKAFETVAEEWDEEARDERSTRIAVAHNKEDNAETIIMQLCRGSGLKGVSGMSMSRDRIIRPLLDVSRNEIESYLKKNGFDWVSDSTNSGCDYTRNRVRHNILPRLTEEVNAGAVDNITRAGKMIRQADEYLEQQAEMLLKSCRNGFYPENPDFEKRVLIPTEIINGNPDIICTYLIRLILKRINFSIKDITARHIEDILNLRNSESGKSIELPYGIRAIKDYEGIIILKQIKTTDTVSPGKICIRDFYYNGESIPDEQYLKWFDYDKINGSVELRFRRPEDHIELKNAGSKPLTVFMTNAKISRDIRDTIPLAVIGSDVVWVVGYRISEKYKIDENTKRIMEIKYTGREQ